ncbi:uncharacterized protein LOC134713993 [Mytilus trossulus]|uniref:uncharacterized protein LOC134713993 n=1 Tax=Mytilus trossulus TaxID=6551 RepID=UPI003004D9BE
MQRQLVKVQDNQSNVEKKVDILIQMLHSKTDASKKGSQKINVPAQIAQSIRCGFQQGMAEKEFIWKTKNEAGNILKYNSAENKEMSDFIIEFVKGQYPDEVEGVVREGIKTNFESFKAKKRREETGKQEEHNKKMAVYSRLKRKLNNRKKALKEKSSMPKEQKETVIQSMEIQYMSSEQTDSEDEGSFIVRPLPWRSDDFDKLVKKLDQKHENKLSKRSRRQNNVRKVGAVSSRKKPEVVPGHEWVFR